MVDTAREPSLRHLKALPGRLPRVLLWIAGIVAAVAGIAAAGWMLG